MSARLSSASVDLKVLLAKAEKGDRTAAMELAQIYKADTVSELLEVVCPLGHPSVEVFNCLADAMALRRELQERRPVVKVK